MSDTATICDSNAKAVLSVVQEMRTVMPQGGFTVARVVRSGAESVETSVEVPLVSKVVG